MDAVGGTCSRIFFPFSLSYFCDELKPCVFTSSCGGVETVREGRVTKLVHVHALKHAKNTRTAEIQYYYFVLSNQIIIIKSFYSLIKYKYVLHKLDKQGY